MGKIKEKLIENDFGAYLYDLREKKGYTIEELAEKINMPSVTIKNIKKWEHDLEFPNLDQMYKLSEIYEVPSEELMQVRTRDFRRRFKRSSYRHNTFYWIYFRNFNIHNCYRNIYYYICGRNMVNI